MCRLTPYEQLTTHDAVVAWIPWEESCGTQATNLLDHRAAQHHGGTVYCQEPPRHSLSRTYHVISFVRYRVYGKGDSCRMWDFRTLIYLYDERMGSSMKSDQSIWMSVKISDIVLA